MHDSSANKIAVPKTTPVQVRRARLSAKAENNSFKGRKSTFAKVIQSLNSRANFTKGW
jgi:hypothetical protein